MVDVLPKSSRKSSLRRWLRFDLLEDRTMPDGTFTDNTLTWPETTNLGSSIEKRSLDVAVTTKYEQNRVMAVDWYQIVANYHSRYETLTNLSTGAFGTSNVTGIVTYTITSVLDGTTLEPWTGTYNLSAPTTEPFAPNQYALPNRPWTSVTIDQSAA